jgi:hypothetical protein
MIGNKALVFSKAGNSSANIHKYLRLPNIATGSLADDGTAMEGAICYDSTTNKLLVYTGAAWETVTSA